MSSILHWPFVGMVKELQNLKNIRVANTSSFLHTSWILFQDKCFWWFFFYTSHMRLEGTVPSSVVTAYRWEICTSSEFVHRNLYFNVCWLLCRHDFLNLTTLHDLPRCLCFFLLCLVCISKWTYVYNRVDSVPFTVPNHLRAFMV